MDKNKKVLNELSKLNKLNKNEQISADSPRNERLGGLNN